jgi:TolB-like protein/Flp pilus assembly protein TadD
MSTFKPQQPITFPEPAAERLDSWKEIAAYLKRDERTVRRWEKEGLPVHRKVHKKQASIFAYKAEIDTWWNSDCQRLQTLERPPARKSRMVWLWVLALGGSALIAGAFLLNAAGIRTQIFGLGTAPIHSIAVLPLENLSGDPNQQYFVDGMTEELTTGLAQISTLRVISHTSAVQYKGTKKTLPQIARELNVDGVIEGAVERSGDKVGIRVQLIQAPSDHHIWAKSYQRDLREVLDLQREVTHAIVDEIKAKLTKSEKAQLASAKSIDSEAYEDYLKGRFLLSMYSALEATKAAAYFRQAIQKDPNHALAYAGLAESYITLGQPWNGGLSPNKVLPQAKAAAEKALEIDASCGEAHSALAHVLELYDWNWQGAEREYRRALDLNPNDSMAHFWFGEYLQAMGRNEEGFAQSRQAIALDPLNAGPIAELGTQFYMARQYDDAIRTFQRAFEVEPDYAWARDGLGWVYAERKMYREAIAELEKAVELSNRNDEALARLGKVLGNSGRKQESRKLLGELVERSKRRYVSPYLVALIQIGLGERDHAIASLERGYINRDQWMLYLKVDPQMDDLRTDPRFRKLLQRVGIPE